MNFKSEKPQISVIMPVFNGEKFVKIAINSILAQSFSDYEFIIINDGSTDKTKSIIQSYIDKRIKYVEHPTNLGIVKSLNNGLDIAEGRYVARMDADDISLPHRLELQLQFLESNPDYVGVGASIQYIDPEGWPIAIYQPQTQHETIDRYLISGHANVIVHSVLMAQKDAITSFNGYQQEYEYAEDLDLFLRLAEIGKLANLLDVLLKVRLHQTSICVQQTDHWKPLKTKILIDAGQRRGIEINLDEIVIGKRSQDDFRLKWANQAFGNKHIHTALKNYIISITQNGIKKRHLDFIRVNTKNSMLWIQDKLKNK